MTQHDPNPHLFESRRHVAILEAISYMAEALLTERDWTIRVDEALAQLGQATGVSRVYLLERRNRKGINFIRQIAEWATSPELQTIEDARLKDFNCADVGLQRWEDLITTGQAVIGNIEDMPVGERAFIEEFNVQSIALVPVMINGICWGAIGFDQCFAARAWSDGEIDALKTASGILGAAVRHNADRVALQRGRDELERRVETRTEELSRTVDKLERAISGRDQIERALRDSEAQYRLLAENATDSISRHGPDGRYLFISPAGFDITGFHASELLGKDPYDYFHPDDISAVRATHMRVAAGPEVQMVSYRLRHKAGHYVDVESTCKSIRDEQTGEIVEIVCTTRNVSDRTRIANEQRVVGDISQFFLDVDDLSDVFNRLPTLLCERFQYSRCAIFLLDAGANEIVFAGVHGLSRKKYLGARYALDTLVSGRVAETGEPMFESDIAAMPSFATSALRHENARAFISVPMRIENRIVGVLNLIDRTPRALPQSLRHTIQTVANLLAIQIERIEAEQRMRQQAAELIHVSRLGTMGEMASGLAHELNQPLAGIVNFTAAATNLIETDPQSARQYIEKAGAAADRASALIRRMRQLVVRRDPKRSTANVNRLINETIALIEHEAAHRNIRISTALQPDMPETPLDGIQIQQVLINLINNAIDAIDATDPVSREITVSTDSTDDRIIVSVSDSGRLESPPLDDRIFVQHFTTKKGGMGLGLSITRTIIESHGGRIEVCRDDLDRTCFRFEIPRSCGFGTSTTAR